MDTLILDTQTLIKNQASCIEKIRINEYQKLKEEGVLIQLDITGASIFTTATDWVEVGVTSDSTRAEWMRPGRKFLFPKEIVDRLACCISKIRQAFNHNTHKLTGYEPYRYLHYKQYESWSLAWSSFQTELAEIKAEMDANYDESIDTLVAKYNAIASEAWHAAAASGADWVTFGKHAYDNIDDFTDALVARVLAKVPSRLKIQTDIQASYKTALIQGLDDIAREEARAARIWQEAEAQAEKIKLETLSMEQQVYHQQKMMRIEEEDKRRRLEIMFHAEAEHIREQLAATTGPIEEAFVNLRQHMAETASDMISKIQNGNFVHGKTAQKALETMSALFEMRSIVDDTRLRERLAQLKDAVGPVGEARAKDTPARDPKAVVNALEAIKDLVASARDDFLAEPSTFSMLEID